MALQTKYLKKHLGLLTLNTVDAVSKLKVRSIINKNLLNKSEAESEHIENEKE